MQALRILLAAFIGPAVGAYAAAAVAQVAPDPALPPSFGEVDLPAGGPSVPFTLSVFTPAGGPVRSPKCEVGFFRPAPSFRVNYSAEDAPHLAIYTEGLLDTVLLVRLPNGNWRCNDDYYSYDYTGLNGGLMIDQPLPGQYDIWVGTYGPPESLGNNALTVATLTLSDTVRPFPTAFNRLFFGRDDRFAADVDGGTLAHGRPGRVRRRRALLRRADRPGHRADRRPLCVRGWRPHPSERVSGRAFAVGRCRNGAGYQ